MSIGVKLLDSITQMFLLSSPRLQVFLLMVPKLLKGSPQMIQRTVKLLPHLPEIVLAEGKVQGKVFVLIGQGFSEGNQGL